MRAENIYKTMNLSHFEIDKYTFQSSRFNHVYTVTQKMSFHELNLVKMATKKTEMRPSATERPCGLGPKNSSNIDGFFFVLRGKYEKVFWPDE